MLSTPPFPVEDLLVSAEACSAPSAAELGHADLLHDLDLLEGLLREGYAGFEPLMAAGLDWDALFAVMREDVRELPDPVPVARVQDWAMRYLEVTGDKHLALWRTTDQGWWVWRAAGRHWDAWLAEARLTRDAEGRWRDRDGVALVECERHDLGALLQPVLESDDALDIAWRPLVLSIAEPPPLRCSFEGEDRPRRLPMTRLSGFEGQAEHERPWDLTAEEPVLAYRLSDLSGKHGPDLQSFVQQAPSMRDAPVVLVDLRDNGGGSDSPVMDLFSRLSDLPLRYDDIDRIDSSAALVADINALTCQLQGEGLDPALRATWQAELTTLQSRLDHWRSEAAIPWREHDWYTPSTEPTTNERWQGRMVVLQDAGCASACETFPMLARQLPGTLVVGENSGGVGEYGETKSFRLPHTGLGFAFGSKWFRHLDPRLAADEGVGHLPDIWIHDTDPHAAASAVAACLAERDCALVLDGMFPTPMGNANAVAYHDFPPPDIEPLVDPASVGAEPAALEQMIDRAIDSRSDGLVVIVDGTTLISWPPDQRPIETMSATKSILNLVVGKLVDEGRIPSVDAPVSTWFPAWAEGEKAEVTVRHLLEHSSGLAAPPSGDIYASGDLLGFALGSNIVTEPGTAFQYNNNAANLLAGIASAAAGEPLDSYARRHFMEPMGITEWHWAHDPKDNVQGGAGLALKADDLARFGTLMLQGGLWEGERLISEQWVHDSTQPGPLLPGCGRLWWMLKEPGTEAVVGYRADGWLGQVLVVIPDRRVVAVRQMRGRPEHWEYGDEGVDTFRDFLGLAQALVPPSAR